MKLINQNGFALAIMVPLLPVLLAITLAAYGGMTFLQIDQKYSYLCRRGGLPGQEKAGKQIEALLKLNPKASKLILRERQAQEEVAATTGTPPMALALIKLGKVQAEQVILNLRQRAIITQGNLALQSAYQKTANDIRKLDNDIQRYDSMFESAASIKGGAAPRLAVSPEGTDIAPTYRTDPDIEQKQILAHRWQYELRMNSHLQRFLSGNFKFQKSCSVSITQKGQSWVPKILRDKY